MIKKLLFIAVLLGCVSVQAQQVSNWKLHPTKSTTPGIVLESMSDMVYYMSGSNLFFYDKETNEIGTLNSGNYLSDSGIKNIYYNYEKGYLMIVYQNSNIDLVFDNLDVINIPDIKNTIMMQSKAINDVVFGNDRVYLATDFGVVILNDSKYEVFESYLYNKVFTNIAKAGNSLISLVDNKLYISKQMSGLYQFDNSWQAVNMSSIPAVTTVKYLYAVNDNNVLIAYDNVSYIYNLEKNTFTAQSTNLYSAICINKSKEGYLATFSDNVKFLSSDVSADNQLQVKETKTLTDSKVKNGYCTSYNNDNSIWCCSSAGLSHFTISNGTLTWLVSPVGYNTSSVLVSNNLQVHNNKLYVKNLGAYNHSVSMYDATVISVYDLETEEWSDMVLDKVTKDGGSSKSALRSSYNLSFDPDNSEVFYVGSWFDGLHKFEGTQYAGNYNQKNSPLAHPWEMVASFSDFDADGNLWVLMISNKLGANTLFGCLPADKQSKSSADYAESDWLTYDVGSAISYKSNLLVCKHSPYVFAIHGATVSATRLTVLNRNTGETRVFSTFTDQDGGSFGNGVLNFLVATEDNNGNVWLGTTSGPLVLNNISNIMNSNYTCTRVKVPRNDGTNYADYLLEDETINTIVVDGANRKWLGTASTGVYLVSENGSEILQHFDADNSLMPSNMVYDMAMDNVSGQLFIGTDMGVVSCFTDVSEVAENYDNVKVFPNPVRPDYTGWITIQGLMDNSLVKITDVAGNLFSQGYSNGGTYVWDGRTTQGERVKTGVYLVYASQSGGKSGVVAKVMIVN